MICANRRRSAGVPTCVSVLALAMLLTLSVGTLAAAEEDPPPPEVRGILDEYAVELLNLDELLETVDLAAGEEALLLSLEECVDLALTQNRDVLIATFEPRIAEEDITGARGIFDPTLETAITYGQTDIEQSQGFSIFGLSQYLLSGGSADSDLAQTEFEVGVGGIAPTGMQYGLSLNASETDLDTSVNGMGSTDTDERTLAVTLSQPMLRGFGIRLNKVPIKKAQIADDAAGEQLRLTWLETVAGVAKTYWGLVGEAENLKVKKATLKSAERLLDEMESRFAVGSASELDVLTAQSGVSRRQSEVIIARTRIDDAGDALKALLDLRQGDRFSNVRVVPADRPDPATLAGVDLTESPDVRVSRALENRPEMRLRALQLRNDDLDVLRARDNVRPSLDVVGSVGASDSDTEAGGAFSADEREDSSFFQVGLQGSVPLGNRSAKSAHRKAKLRREQDEQRIEKTRTDLMKSVHVALRDVKRSLVLLENARKTARLEEGRYSAEEERLLYGVTTTFQVLSVQDDLTAAQTQLVLAETAHQNAIVDLQLAEGTLLDDMGIDFEALHGTNGH